MANSAILLLLSFAYAASAVTDDFDRRYPACVLDRLELCKDGHNLAATFQCLDKNQAKLSSSCKDALGKSPAFQCSFDSLLLCPSARDHYDMMSCIWTQRHEPLTSRCVGSGFEPDRDPEFNNEVNECREDVKQFCEGVSGSTKRMACLANHENELSSECKQALSKCPAFKCAHDAERFCSGSEGHDLLKCIWEHRDEVSEKCKEALNSPPSSWLSQHRHHKKHHGKHCDKHRHDGHHEHHHRDHYKHHGRHHGDHRKECGKHHDGHQESHHEDQHSDMGKHHGRHHHKGHPHHHHHHHRHHHEDHHGHGQGKYFRACKFDIRRFCYDVEGFVDKMACLANHEDELSSSCQMVLKQCPAFHCANDVQKFCPGVKNQHEFIGCLWEHRHELSDECMNQDQDSNGDDNPHSTNDKCRHERERYCPEDQKESPEHDVECLGDREESDLSHACRKSLHIRLACHEEISNFCTSDSTYPLKCLKQHMQELGDACKSSLSENPGQALSASSSVSAKPSGSKYFTVIAVSMVSATVAVIIWLMSLTYRNVKARHHHDENLYRRI